MVNNVRQTDLRVYIGNNYNQKGRRKKTTVGITIKLTTNVNLNLNTFIGKLFLSCESRKVTHNPLQAQLLFYIAFIAQPTIDIDYLVAKVSRFGYLMLLKIKGEYYCNCCLEES